MAWGTRPQELADDIRAIFPYFTIRVREALERDQEMTSGVVQGRSHEEVMMHARRSIGCA